MGCTAKEYKEALVAGLHLGPDVQLGLEWQGLSPRLEINGARDGTRGPNASSGVTANKKKLEVKEERVTCPSQQPHNIEDQVSLNEEHPRSGVTPPGGF